MPEVRVETDLVWIAGAVLVLAFWGEPDLIDAIQANLTGLPIETFLDPVEDD